MNLPRSGSCDNTLDVADPRPPQRSRSYDPDFGAPSSKVGNSDSFLLPLVTLNSPGSLFQSVSLGAAVREAIPIPPSSVVFSLTVSTNRMPATGHISLISHWEVEVT